MEHPRQRQSRFAEFAAGSSDHDVRMHKKINRSKQYCYAWEGRNPVLKYIIDFRGIRRAGFLPVKNYLDMSLP